MDDLTTEDENNEQCGFCRRGFGPGIAPTPTRKGSRMEQGWTDPGRWFVALMVEQLATAYRSNCTDLNAEDLWSLVVFRMR